MNSSSSFLWSTIRRSTSGINGLRRQFVHRRFVDSYSTVAASSTAGKMEDDPDRGVGNSFKLFVGVVASGSAFGVWWLASSFASDLISPRSSCSGSTDSDGVNDGNKPGYLFGDAFRKRIFFKYEKRIRLRSHPEKVFEYFASHHTSEGGIYMTPTDLMKAIVPVFPSSDSNSVREGYLRGERRPGDLYLSTSDFFMLFDTNNDGLISFSEYIFFVTLLSIPESSFSVAFKMFDLDNNGKIERNEFKKVMALMQSYNRQGSSAHKDKRHTVENSGIVEHFFGKDGKEKLDHEKFVAFLRKLHDEIVSLEFAHYDFKSKGTISAKDFGYSMVASADMTHINKFLDRVEEIDSDLHLKNKHITLEEFKSFAEMRRSLKPLALAIFSYGKINGLLSKSDFQRAASHVCGVSLSDDVVDVIFHVFDINNDGKLSAEEFFNVLQRRENDIRDPASMGIAGFLSCCFNCAKSSCPLAKMVI